MTEHAEVVVHADEVVKISKLRAHARNYRGHPESQVSQLEASIRQHGVYRRGSARG